MSLLGLYRLGVLLPVFLLASCGKEPEPIVDMSPIGEAIRFLAVAGVLAVIIRAVLEGWTKD